MNILIGTRFLGTLVRLNVVIGALIGLLGISLVFLPELRAFSLHDHGFVGLLLDLADRAAYTSLLSPLVALCFSTLDDPGAAG